MNRSQLDWKSLGALVCFVGAVVAIAIGFVLTTGSLLDADLHPLLHAVGLVLLIAGIPILILGGHFMDLRERNINHGKPLEH